MRKKEREKKIEKETRKKNEKDRERERDRERQKEREREIKILWKLWYSVRDPNCGIHWGSVEGGKNILSSLSLHENV